MQLDNQTLISRRLELNLPKPKNWNTQINPRQLKTASTWFAERFPDQAKQFGCPFLEMIETTCDGFNRINPIDLNIDFFASILGGDKRLGHSVVYFEPEMQWFFKDSDTIFKPTSPEKLQNLYRGYMIRCAQETNSETDKLNLFREFRSDKVAKAVVHRAKSILAADSSFFSPTSPHQRLKGPELHEKLARKYVDELLSAQSGQVLQLHDAYMAFCFFLKKRDLEPVKRSDFKAIVAPMIRDEFNVCLRNDLVVDGKPGNRGWKNVRLRQTVPT